jgi:YVTN family beta-propeller protein/autotransporter-associated beta strand protein
LALLSALVAAGAFVPDAARAQSGPFIYVPNRGDDNLSVIDSPTNTVQPGTISAGNTATAVAVRGDQSLAYVANFRDRSVSVIDTATNTVTATIAVGSGPSGIAITADGRRVYVANSGGGGTVSVIDSATNSVVATVDVGTVAQGVAVSPDGTRVYVSSSGKNNVSVIDTSTNTVVTTIAVGISPTGVAVSPDGTKAYVANSASDTISVINTVTNTVVATIAGGNGPRRVNFTPDGTKAYVVNANDNTVSIINVTTNTVMTTVAVGVQPNGVTFSPDGTRAYVTNLFGDSVSVIDVAASTVIATLAVGSGPGQPGACGNGNALLTAGLTFVAKQSSALACTGAPGPVFTGGTLQIAGADFASNLPITLQSQGGTIDTNGNSAALSGTISGPGGLTKIGAGTLTLSGINGYAGPTMVNAGSLIVDGSITSSILTTVSSGATLGGSGSVGSTLIGAGGTLAPGPVGGTPGTMTVAGNLTFQSGALYLVQISSSNTSLANVSGSATLAGTVQAAFASGSLMRAYTILSASGGRAGTFDSLSTTGLPGDFHPHLSYTGNNVVLNLVAALEPEDDPATPAAPGTRQSRNEVAIGHVLDNAFNQGSTLPRNFLAVFSLTGSNLDRALDQLDGEVATGAQRVGFQLTDQFLNLMLDPFVDGRSGIGGADRPALGFAPEREPMPTEIALAYASVFKAPPAPAAVYESRWTAWGGAYGGSNRTTGDTIISGTNDLSASTAGVAGGLDYHLTRDTLIGFALAGGGTNWSLAEGLGSGKSDAFQVGVYGATRSGPAYLAAAFAFANHWMSTDRFAFAGDHLTASFNAQSLGGRLEGGYRFGTIFGGLTPYAAVQAQSFRTPSYSETDLNGGGFALSSNGRTAGDTRTELGGRFDRLLLVSPDAALAFRARAAWAHDWVSDPVLSAVFQTLPASNFIVDGAIPAKNSALTSAGAELRLANGVTLLAKFDGEFASHSSTYAGTGAVRYRW